MQIHIYGTCPIYWCTPEAPTRSRPRFTKKVSSGLTSQKMPYNHWEVSFWKSYFWFLYQKIVVVIQPTSYCKSLLSDCDKNKSCTDTYFLIAENAKVVRFLQMTDTARSSMRPQRTQIYLFGTCTHAHTRTSCTLFNKPRITLLRTTPSPGNTWFCTLASFATLEDVRPVPDKGPLLCWLLCKPGPTPTLTPPPELLLWLLCRNKGIILLTLTLLGTPLERGKVWNGLSLRSASKESKRAREHTQKVVLI